MDEEMELRELKSRETKKERRLGCRRPNTLIGSRWTGRERVNDQNRWIGAGEITHDPSRLERTGIGTLIRIESSAP